MMRAVLIAVLVVLACAAVSASSADWSAPEALWSSDLSASELEARHSEFLMDLTASSSSGPESSSSSSGPSSSSSSSSSTGVASTSNTLTFKLSCGNVILCPVNATGINNIALSILGFPNTVAYAGEAINTVFSSNSSSSSSTGVAGRRLLQTDLTDVSVGFNGSPVDAGVHAQKSYAAFVYLLQCDTQACRDGVKQQFNLPGDVNESELLALTSVMVPGSLVADDAVVVANTPPQSTGDREVATVGGPRKTNIGYYVLGAVALAFAVAALIYFIVHRRPAAHATIIKENRSVPEEVNMVPVVAAAPVAATGVQYTPEVEEPAAGYQQQDYKSVFALKHNVLEQKAQEEEDHNHNDVHFILHQ